MNKNLSQVCHSTNRKTTREILCSERNIGVIKEIKKIQVCIERYAKINKCDNIKLNKEIVICKWSKIGV
jgi:hypothetical protein